VALEVVVRLRRAPRLPFVVGLRLIRPVKVPIKFSGRGDTTKGAVIVALDPALFVALTLIENEPLTVERPVTTPVVVLRVSPAGNPEAE
jgi:hypothetical protein